MPKSAAGTREASPGMVQAQDSGGALMEEQAAYDVLSYDLQFRLYPKRRYLEGAATVEFLAVTPMRWLVLDLDPRLKVGEVSDAATSVEGSHEALAWQQRGSKLWVHLGREIPANERGMVRVDYRGQPRVAENAPWDGGFTWSHTEDGQPWIATTVQGEGADLWWPCKDHPSDRADAVTLRVRVPKPLVVAANGRLVEVLEHVDETRTFHWHTAMPISNYNVALNVAPYDTITGEYESVSGDRMPVTYWVLPENRARGEELFEEIYEHLNFYERLLGPYPFRAEKYGVVETPHLGMEHQSIVAYGNRYRGGPHGYDWLHHHELGHEWWGNLVSVSDWSHFWIHEGFCTYMQALYAEEREGLAAYHHAMYENRRKIRNRHRMVPRHGTSMGEMFDGPGNDVYYKGAWVLHMLRYAMGREKLLECLRRFAYPTPEWERRRDGTACRQVTTEDFVRLVEERTGKDWGWFFEAYLHQVALPRLRAERDGNRLALRWETAGGTDFSMPVELEVDGERLRVEMAGGRTELEWERFGDALVDPGMWILKEPYAVRMADFLD